MDKMKNIQAFFDQYAIDQTELISKVRDISPESEIILTGSVPDGRGTRYSDIDVLIMGPRAEEDLRANVHFDLGLIVQNHFRLSGGQEVEVAAMVGSVMVGVVRKLKEAERLLSEPETIDGRIPILDQSTYRFLDDVATGAPLVRLSDEFDVFVRESGLGNLSDFVLLLALVQHLATREDAVAQLERGKQEVALLMLRESVDHLSQAVLASTGIANTRLQWRLHFLDQARAAIGDIASDELRRYLMSPPSDLTLAQDDVVKFGEFADLQIAGIFSRRPTLIPAMGRLSQIVQFQLQAEF